MTISRRYGWDMGDQSTNHAALSLVTAPVVEPVGLREVKSYLRLDQDLDDPLLDTVIQAARERLEGWLRRALIRQTWDLTLDWAPAWVELPYPPLISVTSVTLKGLDYSDVTASPTTYTVTPATRLLALKSGNVWPTHLTPGGFRVRYICGYGDGPEDIPAAIRLSLYNMIAYAYENRMTINEVPEADKVALQTYRIQGPPFRFARGSTPPELLA